MRHSTSFLGVACTHHSSVFSNFAKCYFKISWLSEKNVIGSHSKNIIECHSCFWEAWSKPFKISKKEIFAKIVSSWKLLNVFTKTSILDVWQGSEHASASQHSDHKTWICHMHCVKSARVRSFCGPYFPAFGLNTEMRGNRDQKNSKYEHFSGSYECQVYIQFTSCIHFEDCHIWTEATIFLENICYISLRYLQVTQMCVCKIFRIW